MRKAAVRDGDRTTTGGYVTGTSDRINDKGKKVALTDDHATCGNCKGTYKIFGTGKSLSDNGRIVVVDGDSVLCPCGKNRVIVGRDPGYFLNIADDAVDASDAVSAAQSAVGTSVSVVIYDEQVRAAASGIALDGYPYFIETADRRVFSGRLDANGRLPRIETVMGDDYTVHWGDEALARQNGA